MVGDYHTGYDFNDRRGRRDVDVEPGLTCCRLDASKVVFRCRIECLSFYLAKNNVSIARGALYVVLFATQNLERGVDYYFVCHRIFGGFEIGYRLGIWGTWNYGARCPTDGVS